MSLSDRDKIPAPHGYGYYFEHTVPQRRVLCVLGDMLAPLSADDIPPITPEAMASVQTALTLLAQLVGDRDHGLFLGSGPAKLEEYRGKARDILLAARGLTGVLRVEAAPPPSEPVAAIAWAREGDPINWSYVRHTVGDMQDDAEYQPVRVQLPDGSVLEAVNLVKDVHGQWTLVASARS
jgi:hypothetical protein